MGVETRDVFGTLYSVNVIAKARRFCDEQRVKPVENQADLWEVTGDHGTYRVRHNPRVEERGVTGMWCTCPLRDHRENLITICSHGLAVRYTMKEQGR